MRCLKTFDVILQNRITVVDIILQAYEQWFFTGLIFLKTAKADTYAVSAFQPVEKKILLITEPSDTHKTAYEDMSVMFNIVPEFRSFVRKFTGGEMKMLLLTEPANLIRRISLDEDMKMILKTFPADDVGIHTVLHADTLRIILDTFEADSLKRSYLEQDLAINFKLESAENKYSFIEGYNRIEVHTDPANASLMIARRFLHMDDENLGYFDDMTLEDVDWIEIL